MHPSTDVAPATPAGTAPTDEAGQPIAAASGPKPLKADAESTQVLRDFQNSLPPELQGKTPNFGTTPVDREQLSALVAREDGNPDKFNTALRSLAGANPEVSSTPVVLHDGSGNTGTMNLFQVKDADGKNYLVDSQGAHYTDFNDYLRNNTLPEDLTVTRPADLGDPTGDAGSLITSPAHPATGFWPTIEKGGKWLTATGKSLRERGSALNSETPALSTGLGSGLNSAGAGLEFLGSIVTGVSSGEDLTSRFRHGQGIALDDPRAQADYLNVLSGASNVAVVVGGAAGAAGREAAALAAARGASVLAAPGVGNQASRLYQDWDKLSPAERLARGAELTTSAGLLAAPFVGKLTPKGESGAQLESGQAPRTIMDEGKLDYIFGKVTSSPHNTARSIQMKEQLARVGIFDSPQSRQLLRENLSKATTSPNNIQRAFETEYGKFEVRDSLLAGPRGILKIESTWQQTENGLKLTTIIPYGGR